MLQKKTPILDASGADIPTVGDGIGGIILGVILWLFFYFCCCVSIVFFRGILLVFRISFFRNALLDILSSLTISF